MFCSLFQFQSNRHPSIWILWEIIIKTDLCRRRNMWICCWMRMFHFKSYISFIFDEYMDDSNCKNKYQVWFVENKKKHVDIGMYGRILCNYGEDCETDIASNFNVIAKNRNMNLFKFSYHGIQESMWRNFLIMEFKSLGEVDEL